MNTNLVRGTWRGMVSGSEGLGVSMGTGIYRVSESLADSDLLISLVYIIPTPNSKTDMGSPPAFSDLKKKEPWPTSMTPRPGTLVHTCDLRPSETKVDKSLRPG